MKTKRYLFLSVLIHAALVLLAFRARGGQGKGDGDSQGKSANRFGGVQLPSPVLPKLPPETEVSIVEREPGEITIKKPEAKPVPKNAVKECKDTWYGGLGIETSNLGEEVISEVFPGYAADLAGLVVGDVIEDVVGGIITGDPGTVVEMRVRHNGVSSVMYIIRTKVCY